MPSQFHTPVKTTHSIFLAVALCAALLGTLSTTASVLAPPDSHRKMSLTSTAFKDGQPIPQQYTCDDKNISPPLAWSGTPSETTSLVLIVDDSDAPSGLWTHWVVFDMPGTTSELPENAPNSIGTPALNDFKHANYGGPCPPAGKVHRYFFKIYALDTTLNLPSGAPRTAVETAMAKHILAQGQLMGIYQRK